MYIIAEQCAPVNTKSFIVGLLRRIYVHQKKFPPKANAPPRRGRGRVEVLWENLSAAKNTSLPDTSGE